MGGILLAFFVILNCIDTCHCSVSARPDLPPYVITPQELEAVHLTLEEYGIDHFWNPGPKGETPSLTIRVPKLFRHQVETMLYPRTPTPEERLDILIRGRRQTDTPESTPEPVYYDPVEIEA